MYFANSPPPCSGISDDPAEVPRVRSSQDGGLPLPVRVLSQEIRHQGAHQGSHEAGITNSWPTAHLCKSSTVTADPVAIPCGRYLYVGQVPLLSNKTKNTPCTKENMYLWPRTIANLLNVKLNLVQGLNFMKEPYEINPTIRKNPFDCAWIW